MSPCTNQAEQKFKELRSKKDGIVRDRQLIEDTIDELDLKKKTTIVETWKRVNKDFGSIFSCLLPGTECKLEPEEGKTIHEGLEVKIAFGGAWKDRSTGNFEMGVSSSEATSSCHVERLGNSKNEI